MQKQILCGVMAIVVAGCGTATPTPSPAPTSSSGPGAVPSVSPTAPSTASASIAAATPSASSAAAAWHSVGTTTGLTGLTTGTQYQLFINAEHEAMALAALNVTWANTGRVAAGAPTFTTVSPTFDFGKGFGDLPDSLPWLRPFALTGNLSLDIPTAAATGGVPNPTSFFYGFAIEYSIPYLQSQVKDLGLRPPFNRLIPLVEFALTTPFGRIQPGMTTGTVQPGVIWAGQYFQLGAEIIIPTNSLSGRGIGGVVQLHFYLDDLFPRSIGRPISQW